MAKYRINELSFIDNRLVRPGDEIESDERPAPHWEPLDKVAKATSKTTTAEDEAAAEDARLEAAARALKDSPTALTPLTAQEQARIEAEAAAAAAQAAAESAEAKPADDPLV